MKEGKAQSTHRPALPWGLPPVQLPWTSRQPLTLRLPMAEVFNAPGSCACCSRSRGPRVPAGGSPPLPLSPSSPLRVGLSSPKLASTPQPATFPNPVTVPRHLHGL